MHSFIKVKVNYEFKKIKIRIQWSINIESWKIKISLYIGVIFLCKRHNIYKNKIVNKIEVVTSRDLNQMSNENTQVHLWCTNFFRFKKLLV